MRTLLAPALLVLATASGSLNAQDLLVRRFGGESGLVSTVVALAQDSTGFLWAGTRAGLYRYDGRSFQRWAPEALPRAVGSVVVSPEGRVVVVDADGRILEVTRDGAHQLAGAARRSPNYAQVAAFDAGGRLWVITQDGDVAWRADGGGWRTLPPGALQGDTVRRIFPGGTDGGILLASGDGLWKIDPGVAPERLLEGRVFADARVLPDGRVAALSAGSWLVVIGPAGTAEISPADAGLPITRGISLTERDGTFWLGTDRFLVALEPDGTSMVLGPEQEVAAGGPVLVDHEGSLWHAGFTTLSQYPEPRTLVWDERHGLPSPHTRFLGRSGDVTWVTTWHRAGVLRSVQGRWEAEEAPIPRARGVFCDDGEGGLRVGADGHLYNVRGGVSRPATAFPYRISTCHPASGGGDWVGTGAGLYHMSADATRLTPVASFPYGGDSRQIHAVVEDRSGRLLVGSWERVCQARASRVLDDPGVTWSCHELPAGTVHLNAMVETESGAIWAVSSALGVLRLGPDGWRLMEDTGTLPTRAVLNLVRSPRGGVWLVGNGFLWRVRERPDADGWVVVEELGRWHGLPFVGGGDLLEREDGTLWIATAGGVVRVPPTARAAEPRAPRVELVEARVDGEPVPLDRPVVLSADRNRLELRFAALTFRDPAWVRYQVRLSPDDDWADAEGGPSFHWVDLPSGLHRPQARASLDGVTWSPEPAELAFRVLPPWYRAPWAIATFVVLTGALLLALYRARLAYLLGLERQRTRIAMDLHDEMGSGLASIGILASVMSGEAEVRDGDGHLAREVAVTAEELGTALSDIVWSLDPRSATLEELGARLAEHGGRLFADDVEFDIDFPDRWPAESLPLPVLRNVLLIGLEGLHNAARHAGAEHVRLSLRPEGDWWVLSLADDGTGLPAGAGEEDGRPGGQSGRSGKSGRRGRSGQNGKRGPGGQGGPGRTGVGSGRGRRGMRRRAAEIGGEIAWESRRGEGTTVRLRFRPVPRRGRVLRWLGRWRPRPRVGSGSADPHEHASAAESPAVHS